MKRNYITLLLSLINIFAFSQTEFKAEDFQAALLPSKKGATVVYNGQQHSFTIDVVGDSVKPSEQPNFLIVDNKILQTSIIPFQSKLDFDNLDENNQKGNLLAHKDYELNYIKTELKQKVANEKYEFLSLNNKVFLFWYYDIKENKQIGQQCYLTSICFDQMLVLNSPVFKDNHQGNYMGAFSDIQELLTRVGMSLKLNNHAIDLEKFYKELNGN